MIVPVLSDDGKSEKGKSTIIFREGHMETYK
jgi:hypothetical protein